MDLGLSRNDKPNPRENANIFSVLTFWYTLPTFVTGYKKDFEVSDLYKTFTDHQSKILGDRIEVQWKKEKNHSLRRVLFKMFGGSFLLQGMLLLLCEVLAKLMQPLLLGELIEYFTAGETDITKSEAYAYAGGIVGCGLLQAVVASPFLMGVAHIGMKMRVTCCCLIYRKALRLSKTALGETSVGQMVNLLSNDVNRFDTALIFAHFLWIAPLQFVIAIYLVYRTVGISAIFGACVSLIFIGIMFGTSKILGNLRSKTAYKTDERSRLMNELISGIQVIKMYVWEKPLTKFVSLVRRNEVRIIRRAHYIRGITASFFLFSSKLSLFITVAFYIFLGGHITAKKVFILSSYYDVLRLTLYSLFQQAVAQVAELNISVKRLNNFLMLDEKQTSNNVELDLNYSNDAITIISALAKWNQSASDNTFQNLTIRIKARSLVAIIGPVGCGKSNLLQLILEELPLIDGSLKVNGIISYASQEPWIFSGTIRQNILFNKPYDKDRYIKIITICSLSKDFALFPNGDMTLVGDRGISLSGGQRARINLARAVYQEADIYLLDDPLSAVDAHVGRKLFDDCITEFLRDKTVILVTHQLHFLKDVDEIFILGDGKVKAKGKFDELIKLGLDFAKLLNIEKETDNDNQTLNCGREPNASSATVEDVHLGCKVTNVNEEKQMRGNVSFEVYKSYISAGTNWFVVAGMFLLFLMSQFILSFSEVFISRCRNLNLSEFGNDFWEFSTETYVYVYIGIVTALVVVTLLRSFSFFAICMRSSLKLHDQMLRSIVKATITFFTTNPSGRILNRFSKDMGLVDESLPNVWLLVPTVVLAIMFHFLRKFYLASSRNIKRLEGLTKSPVFSHLNASLQGLTTIRALRAESALMMEFDSHQDLHSTTYFLYLSTARAFGYWLDLICIMYILIVTFSLFAFEDSTTGSSVGLVITQSVGIIGLLQWSTRQSAEVENYMTSVERILEYSKIEQEDSVLNKELPDLWPQRGEIKFVGVFLSYFPEVPFVLKDLSFTIKPREKIGIVGRTGAGKSSIINAIFQLTNTKGSILIDEIDIKEIGLSQLRSKISIIPQEPVLFSGTMRKNLDPFGEHSDEMLWKALEDVELKTKDLGLNSVVFEGGANFSVGQRQLICLARAILRNNKILILDEATANIDPQTDELIQKTIRKKFAQCTVLTICHRLNTIMDSDKILVMDAGTMIEFDHPSRLLENANGVFHGMALQDGLAVANTVHNVLRSSYSAYINSNFLLIFLE
ncbi:hypothetical protein RI129_005427 [Pyrocoelia pectoralis]|uniref:Uncharacterized protein n=1 Tax=Pyrocoelia pectoralis TaxID=417401 RepID=A0AAN7VJZ0_9COLE